MGLHHWIKLAIVVLQFRIGGQKGHGHALDATALDRAVGIGRLALRPL